MGTISTTTFLGHARQSTALTAAILLTTIGIAATAEAGAPAKATLAADLSDRVVGAAFGMSVALQPGTAVVGDQDAADRAGHAYVYASTSQGWKLTATLTPSDPQPGAQFGQSVAISGDLIVVGAPRDNVTTAEHGRAYVFEKSSGSWKQVAELHVADEGARDAFGTTVAVSGGTVAVQNFPLGSFTDTCVQNTYLFTETNGTWKPSATLCTSFVQNGKTVAGSNCALALVGTTLATGDCFSFSARVPGHPYYSPKGSVDVWSKTASGWTKVADLKGRDTVAGDQLGGSVSISGTSVAAGTIAGDKAYVFSKTAKGWQQSAEPAPAHPQAGDTYGWSVALSGTRLLVAAPGLSSRVAAQDGTVYVFDKSATGWTQTDALHGPSTISAENLGYSVALDGQVALAGAPGFSSASPQAGHAYVFSGVTRLNATR